MKVIVGLGNPGVHYAGTRHNAGFMVVSRLADRWSFRPGKMLCRSVVSQGEFSGEPVALALPQTMMNSSGEAVKRFLGYWKIGFSDLLVVCDDVALPLGTVRLRGQGSDGGHNGLASIVEATGTKAIPRLRVGIESSETKGDLVEFVLGRFRPSEKKLLEEGLASAEKACEVWVEKGLQTAMNLFNKKGSRI